MTESDVKGMLIRHEGLKLRPYLDTVGKITLGVGRNIEDIGISADEALFMLDNDIRQRRMDLARMFPWYGKLDSVRQAVLLDMSFMGIERLKGFSRMFSALAKSDFNAAASEMLNSKWASEVKGRAVELAEMMRSGEYK